jgi:uncharacterized metal-binding protein
MKCVQCEQDLCTPTQAQREKEREKKQIRENFKSFLRLISS